MPPRLLLLASLLLLGGCLWPVREHTDRMVNELASRPIDLAPPEPAADKPKTEERPPAAKTSGSEADAETPEPAPDVKTVALMQADRGPDKGVSPPTIPSAVPGSEAPLIPSFKDMRAAQKRRAIRQLYPELPPLPDMPIPQPGPNGRPYTLADLQQLAAEYSPTLHQAAADVNGAEGALIQTITYQNPAIGYSASPTNNNSNAGAQGAFMTQHITTFGKRPLAIAAARKDLDNARLALRRARYDLCTNVRNAYFALIVAQETMRVTLALARFTDQVYRWNTNLLEGIVAAPYEPAGLRAQVFSIRLAYQQAITGYAYAWKQLVAILGLPQLPLTAVAGRVDHLIPYYDYDKVLAHVLARHTDVLTARNGVERARYSLKLAQITPYPDMDLYGAVWKESTIPPYVIFYSAQVSFPLPIWDQNKGNIMSAQASLVRAAEELRRVEMNLTNTLAGNYTNYRNNLYALDYYRRNILPDQVRFYRGIFDRRQVDINASPYDLVGAQQALVTNVQTYLGLLGSLWTSVVSVADLMQTDDLFQMATPQELPELPALDNLPRWLCPPRKDPPPPAGQPAPAPAGGPALPGDDTPVLPAPRPTTQRPALPPAAGPRPEAPPSGGEPQP